MDFGRSDYNLLDTSSIGAADDEPGLLIRGQDALSGKIAAIYAVLAEDEGLFEIARVMRAQAVKIAAWPTKKRPDLPKQGAFW